MSGVCVCVCWFLLEHFFVAFLIPLSSTGTHVKPMTFLVFSCHCLIVCSPGFRVLLDRAHSDYDNAFHHLDLESFSSSQHSSISQFANTSETNTSDKSFSKDLSQILVNIKSCRWRHFRPRTPSLHDSDNDELSCRKLYRGLNRTGTAQPGTQTCSTSIQSKSSSGSAHIGMFILTNLLLEVLNLHQKIQNTIRSSILDIVVVYFDGNSPSSCLSFFATLNLFAFIANRSVLHLRFKQMLQWYVITILEIQKLKKQYCVGFKLTEYFDFLKLKTH